MLLYGHHSITNALSEIDGIVNLISRRRAKERHLIFGACWRHCSVRCEIFAENQIFVRVDLPVCSRPTNTTKWNPEKWTKETQKLMSPLEWRRNRNFEGSKSYRKKSCEALWTGSSGGNLGSTAHKSTSEWRWVVARADAAPWQTPCIITSQIYTDKAQMCSRKFGPVGSTDAMFSCSMTAKRARTKKTLPINKMRCHTTLEDMVMTIPYQRATPVLNPLRL